MSIPEMRAGRSVAISMGWRGGAWPTTVTPGSAVPPAYWTSSSTTRSAAGGGIGGGHPVGGGRGDRGVHPALVALPGLGGELVPLAGPKHRDRVPVGRLDQHARR